MENSGVVIDTSIFIEHLRATNKTQTTLWQIPEQTEIFISSVTLYELLMGATNHQKHKDVIFLTQNTIVLPFDEEVSKRAATIYHELRVSNKMIEFRDIFIAATCLTYNLQVKTLNINHFKRIEGIKFM